MRRKKIVVVAPFRDVAELLTIVEVAVVERPYQQVEEAFVSADPALHTEVSSLNF